MRKAHRVRPIGRRAVALAAAATAILYLAEIRRLWRSRRRPQPEVRVKTIPIGAGGTLSGGGTGGGTSGLGASGVTRVNGAGGTARATVGGILEGRVSRG